MIKIYKFKVEAIVDPNRKITPYDCVEIEARVKKELRIYFYGIGNPLPEGKKLDVVAGSIIKKRSRISVKKEGDN